MVDTGAACCVIRKDIFTKLCNQQHRSALLKPARKLCSVNDGELKTHGETEIKFEGLPPVNVVVVSDVRQEFILGGDVLQAGKAKINYEDRVMSLFDQVYSFEMDVAAVNSEIKTTSGHFEIDEVLEDVAHVFATEEDPLGLCTEGQCTVDTQNHPPIRQRPYRLPLAKRYLVEEQIKEMLEAGVIQPSSSPWASPITLQPKKNGKMRFCIDYRKVNKVSIKDSYPLPLIQDIFDQLEGAKIFSTIDLKAGYWQIPMAEEDIEKTAFVCEQGLFEFTRMPFGLTSAPSQFQRIMNKILSGFIGKFVFVYLDDIVIYSQTPEEHAHHLRLVLNRLAEYHLKVNREKCTFCSTEVELLGFIVSEQGIAPNPNKTEAIRKLPIPQDVRAVRSFLGMTGYYRQCIPEYAKHAAPLVKLTKKFARFEWGPEHQKGFEYLKEALVTHPILAYPNTRKPYKLYTDACNYAIGAILVQDDEEGVERVIHYVSHQLNENEQKWATIEKEAYAVVYALKKLKTYLWGSDVTVFTDHKPLKSLFLQEVQNTRIQRWAVLRAEFGAEIKYRPGRCHVRADMLSRIKPESQISVFDTEDYIHPDAFPDDACDMRTPLEADGLEKSAIMVTQRQEFGKELEQATDSNSEYILVQGLLYSTKEVSPTAAKYPRLVLPQQYRNTVIKRCHLEIGHQATQKTFSPAANDRFLGKSLIFWQKHQILHTDRFSSIF